MIDANIFARIDADLIEPQRLAACVRDELLVDRGRPPTRRYGNGITAREALQALWFEAHLVAVAAENLATGIILADADRVRLLIAWGHIDAIVQEAVR